VTEFTDALTAKVTDLTTKANGIAAQLKTSDPKAALDAFLTTSEDEQVVKYRAFREQATAQLKAAQEQITAYAQSNLTVPDTTQLAEERAKLVREIRAIVSLLKDEGIDPATLPKIDSAPRNSSPTGGSVPRTRIASITVDGERLLGKDGKVTLTTLAAHLKVSGASVREALGSLEGKSGQEVTATINGLSVVVVPA